MKTEQNSPVQGQSLLKIPDVADRLQLGRSTVYKLIQRGVLKGIVHVGRSIRVRSNAVDEFIDNLPALDIDEGDAWQVSPRYVEDVAGGRDGIQTSAPFLRPSPAAPHTNIRAQGRR